MQLLKQYDSTADAETLAARLRGRGILTSVSSVASKRLGSHATGALRVGVWVVLDNQAEDAVALLRNHQHVVQHPLNAEEMRKLETEGGASLASMVGRSLNKLVILVVMVLTAIVAYRVVWHS